jgi:hypothetical protein
VGKWLQKKGRGLGRGVVGRHLAVLWPEDRMLYKGRVVDFNDGNGEHQVSCGLLAL